MRTLFTPWRIDYIQSSSHERETECFFCRAAEEPDDPERLLVHLAEHHLVMLNRYPYSNGHVMVAPRAHWASPAQSSEAARRELWPLAVTVQEVLFEAYTPDGMNLGMNVGRAAGAGVADHFHLHVVPRWEGDTNFMGVVAGVRRVPESLYDSWSRLRELFARRTAG